MGSYRNKIIKYIMIRNPQDKSEIIVLIAYWVGVALIITFAKYG